MTTPPQSTTELIDPGLDPALLFGLMLLSAAIGGHVAHWCRMPRVVGFLLMGALLRAVLWGVYARSDDNGYADRILTAAAEHLNPIKDLALGLILFMIGGVFERSRFKAAGARTRRISLAETGTTVVLVFGCCLAAAAMMPTGLAAADCLVLALLLGMAAIATAPAATLFVLQEYEAKGSITETILALTGFNNVVCIVLFYSVFWILAGAGAITTGGGLGEHMWLALALTTFGSVSLGIVVAALLSVVHAKLPLAETFVIFFALFVLLGAGESWLLDRGRPSFNFLLTALVVGGVFANVALDSKKLLDAVRTAGAPILVLFFVMAGYSLHIADLPNMGLMGIAYVAARMAGKWFGCRIGVRWSDGRVSGPDYGTALLCQAAVVIGLAAFVTDNWDSPAAARFSTIVMGSVVLFELCGPLLLKRCVVAGGEVKAMTLLRRDNAASGETSVVRITLRALLGLLGIGARTSAAADGTSEAGGSMSVKHIMRTNVQLIPASANLDELLHFIERSTQAHFPVVQEDGSLAGVIHFSDVRDVIYDPTLRDLVTAVDLADPNSAVVGIDMELTDLLDVFEKQNVAVLPVVEGGDGKRIVGLVEQRDVLRALHVTREANG